MTEINYKDLYEKVQAKLNTIHTEVTREVDNLTKYITEISPREIIIDKGALLHDIKEHNKRLAKIIDSCNSHNITDGDRDKIKEMWEFYKMFRKHTTTYKYKSTRCEMEDLEDGRIILQHPKEETSLKICYNKFAEDYEGFTEKYKEK
jgi:sulfur relay (sulfurtransferase) DsrC/TusE family protein